MRSKSSVNPKNHNLPSRSGKLVLGVIESLLLLPVSSAISDKTFFACGVRRVGAGVRESFATILALEGLLAGVNALVFFKVMLELESFATMRALELSQVRPVRMV